MITFYTLEDALQLQEKQASFEILKDDAKAKINYI